MVAELLNFKVMHHSLNLYGRFVQIAKPRPQYMKRPKKEKRKKRKENSKKQRKSNYKKKSTREKELLYLNTYIFLINFIRILHISSKIISFII
jgi:hypothetical protein